MKWVRTPVVFPVVCWIVTSLVHSLADPGLHFVERLVHGEEVVLPALAEQLIGLGNELRRLEPRVRLRKRRHVGLRRHEDEPVVERELSAGQRLDRLGDDSLRVDFANSSLSHRFSYILLMISSPNAEQDRSVAPSICRSRS